MDYKEAYNLVEKYINDLHLDKQYILNNRINVSKEISKKLLLDLGWKWKATMLFGSGCKVHCRESELPKGTIILSLSKYLVCVKDGIIQNICDCSRNEKRCVYGYYYKES